MINLMRENILSEINKISEEEGINPKIFSKKNIFRYKNKIGKIRKEYFQFLNVFLSGIPIYKLEDRLGLSRKIQEKEMQNNILCFKGTFRSFLKGIKEKYPHENIWWGIKK